MFRGQRGCRIAFALTILMTLRFSLAYSQEAIDPAAVHPWARLQPGSWRKVRDVCETLDRTGSVTGKTTSDTITTLAERDEKSYTLCTETTIEIGGKKFVGQPRFTTFGLHGELIGRSVLVKKTGESEIEVGGVRIPAEVRQVIVEGAEERQVSSVYFSERTPPHILKRETVATDSGGKATRHQTTLEVVAVEIPYPVLSEVKQTAYVRTIQSQPGGTKTVQMSVHCQDVPGSVVYQTTKKMDQAGNITERRTFELVDYESLRSDEGVRTGRRRLLPRNRGRN